MARKRITLPKDFEARLGGPLDDLIAVFDACELAATGGFEKHTAIGFLDCPDDLIVWLHGQGLDVDTPSKNYAKTPLYARASIGWARQIPLLVSLAADVNALAYDETTPLLAAAAGNHVDAVRVLLEAGAHPTPAGSGSDALTMCLLRATNANLAQIPDVAALLLAAGNEVTPAMRERVAEIGRSFEFHRADFNLDSLAETDAALTRLYELFDVAPVPRRVVHDDAAPIALPEGSWEDQHHALWELLVPSGGPASTVQGEVIRASGRVHIEIFGNGGVNWSRDYSSMLRSLVSNLGSGTPLSEDDQAEARAIAKGLAGGDGDAPELDRLCELAVRWVGLNPDPVPLPKPKYRN